jgi:hypothetical protein
LNTIPFARRPTEFASDFSFASLIGFVSAFMQVM